MTSFSKSEVDFDTYSDIGEVFSAGLQQCFRVCYPWQPLIRNHLDPNMVHVLHFSLIFISSPLVGGQNVTFSFRFPTSQIYVYILFLFGLSYPIMPYNLNIGLHDNLFSP